MGIGKKDLLDLSSLAYKTQDIARVGRQTTCMTLESWEGCM